ncbi:adenosine deaminase [Rhizoctonia solani AG-1 IA]|uniref:Adenosine deaminase n=1 Tax=Thanatephorus cucumeris (strain AG1-IA) TaxID=983506 RepID=L8WXT6_THACA|nr:adenosine deaminase [Rhizoctonia solani AG-1 IA]
MGGIDSDVNEHLRKRASLIATENALRFDSGAITNATENEKRAVEIVENLRMCGAKEIWNASEGVLMHPGMDFLTAKEIISELNSGHRRCDVKFIYNLALEYPAIHIRVNSKVTPNAPLPMPEFKPLPPNLIMQYAGTPLLTCANYVPGTWISLQKARNGFLYGGPEGFDKWILGSATLGAGAGTKNYAALTKAILKRVLRRIILSLIEDEDGSETLSHRDYLILFDEAIQEIKDRMRSEGRDDEFVGAKEKLRWYLEDCMALKAEFPNLIAGFDFLGPERRGHPLEYYIEPLVWFKQETKNRGLDIPFVFLVGEPMSSEDKSDSNLYDALLLGAKRIGHGLNLAKHPLLMQMAKERGVAVEVCTISSELLGLTSPIHHPLTTLLNYGVPVVLCPDNPASYGYAGLSFDFFQVDFCHYTIVSKQLLRKSIQAMVCSTSSNLLSLKQLAKQSIQEMKNAYEAWEKRWSVFVDTIVSGRFEPPNIDGKQI